MGGNDDASIGRAVLAFGIARYDDPSLNSAPDERAATETDEKSMADRVAEGVEQSVRTVLGTFVSLGYTAIPNHPWDLTTEELRQALRLVPDAGAMAVVYYTGHGTFKRNGYYLCTKDYDSNVATSGFPTRDLPPELVRWAGRDMPSDVQQPTLVILDCCFAGEGAREIARDALIGRPLHPDLWLWATAGDDTADAGAFATEFVTALNKLRLGNPPAFLLEEIKRELCSALPNRWAQTLIEFAPPHESVPRFFPNPQYIKMPPDSTVAETRQIKQHWIDKARGGSETEPVRGWYICGTEGRSNAITALASWISNPAQGPLAVVTGGRGCGKSTVLSLIVLLSGTEVTKRVLDDAPRNAFLDKAAELLPQRGSVMLIDVHAKGLSADQVARDISQSLGLQATTAAELSKALNERPAPAAAIVVMDAIDEAGESATMLIETLIQPLARLGLRTLIGARTECLAPVSDIVDCRIDLDDDEYRDPDAVIAYVSQLLVARFEDVRTPYRDPVNGLTHPNTATVAAGIARRASDQAQGKDSFVDAKAIALAVRRRDEPINTDIPEWEQQLPAGLPQAFEEDLRRIEHNNPVAGPLLEALAWALGPGLPWALVWAPVAAAIRDMSLAGEILPEINDAAIRALLRDAGNYIVEELDSTGRSVFRPSHQLLTDHLRGRLFTRMAIATGQVRHDVGLAIAKALSATVPTDSAGIRQWSGADPYLRRYLPYHARDAGTETLAALLSDAGFLAWADPDAITPLLSSAWSAHAEIARIYRRARPMLGHPPANGKLHDDPALNAAYLLEAAAALTWNRNALGRGCFDPAYITHLAAVRPDDSVTTLKSTSKKSWEALLFVPEATDGADLVSSASQDTFRWSIDVGDPVGHFWREGLAIKVALQGTTQHGALLATAELARGRGLGIDIFDATSGEHLRGWTDPGLSFANRIALGEGADGRPIVAVADNPDVVHVRDAFSGDELLRQIEGPFGADSPGLAFGPRSNRGPLLAVARRSDVVELWDPNKANLERRLWSTRRRKWLDGRLYPFLEPVAPFVGIAAFSVYAICTLTFLLAFVPVVHRWVESLPSVVSVVFTTLFAVSGMALWLVTRVVRNPKHMRRASVAYGQTPEGTSLVAATVSQGRVAVWDSATGRLVGPKLPITDSPILTFGEWSDGQYVLASAEYGGQVKLWDPFSGKQIGACLQGHTGPVLAAAFGTTVGGQTALATSDEHGQIKIWNPGFSADADRSGASVHWSWAVWRGKNPDNPSGRWKYNLRFGRAAFATSVQGDTVLVTVTPIGVIQVFDLDTKLPHGDPIRLKLPGAHWRRVASSEDDPPVHDLAFATRKDGRTVLLTHSSDDSVRIWDPLTGDRIDRLQCRRLRATGAELQKGLLTLPISFGGWLKAGSYGGRFESQPALRTMAYGEMSDGRGLIATWGGDEAIHLWDSNSGEEFSKCYDQTPFDVAFLRTDGGEDLLVALNFDSGSGSGELSDYFIQLWSPSSATKIGERLYLYPGAPDRRLDYAAAIHAGRVSEVPVLAIDVGLWVPGHGLDRHVQLWNPVTHAHMGEFEGNFIGFGLSPVGRPTLVTEREGYLHIWDTQSGSRLAKLARRSHQLGGAVDGSRIAITDPEGVAVLEVAAR